MSGLASTGNDAHTPLGGLDAGHLAVLAHALLGSTAVVCGTARTLGHRLDVLDGDAQRALLAAVEAHGAWMADVLGLLARGLAAQALETAADPPRRVL